MTTFSAFDIGRTGMGFAHHWLDTVAHNLANANTVTNPEDEPFRALHAVARPLDRGPFSNGGSGVYMADRVREGGDAPLVHEPGHPLADEQGFVAQPVMDLAGQMVDLMAAQRTYQANVQSLQSAREAYESALRLGGRQ